MIIDISLRRESNCPVHFIWDGNGLGRPLVRLGFLLAVITGALLMMALMIHDDAVHAGARFVAVAAAVTWLSGQLLTRLSLFRARAR